MNMFSLQGIARVACASVLSLGFMTAPSLAEVTATYDGGGRDLFNIAVPDHWVLATGGFENYASEASEKPAVPRVLGMRPENDNRLWVGFLSPDGVSNVAQAGSYIRNLDKRLVESPQIEEKRTTSIGGRSATYFHGEGQRNGKPVDFTVGVIDLPSNRVAIFVIAGEHGARSLYRDELNDIVRSFRVGQ